MAIAATAAAISTPSPYSAVAAAPLSSAPPNIICLAARQLRALGLSVLVVWQPADSEAPGTVLSVRPGGRAAVGSKIELDVASSPAAPSTAPAERAGPAASPGHAKGPGPGKGPAPEHHPPHHGNGKHDAQN